MAQNSSTTQLIVGIGCGGGFLLVFIYFAIILGFSSPRDSYSNSSSNTDSGSQGHAYVCAKNKVKSQLKSPSTADFPFVLDADITHNGGDRYTVKSYVDAENAFGAKIRTNFTCNLNVKSASNCSGSCTLN